MHINKLGLQRQDEGFQKQIEAMDVSETGFKAIQSGLTTITSSIEKGNAAIHTRVEQIGAHLQQIIMDHVSFGASKYITTPLTQHPNASRVNSVEADVYWKFRFTSLPIGKLQMNLRQSKQIKLSERRIAEGHKRSEIKVIFVPPAWFSSIALEYTFCFYKNLSDTSWWPWNTKLRPLVINHDPFFNEALRYIDVQGVQKSFREGRARPTDFVISYGIAVPWYYAFSLLPSDDVCQPHRVTVCISNVFPDFS